MDDFGDALIDHIALCRHRDERQLGAVPYLMLTHFGHGYVHACHGALLERLHHPPLLLQAVGAGDINMGTQKNDVHGGVKRGYDPWSVAEAVAVGRKESPIVNGTQVSSSADCYCHRYYNQFSRFLLSAQNNRQPVFA